MDPRRSDDPLMVAARQLVEHLAGDAVFVKQVADEEISRRIAAGLLIPTDRLQLAPGLTLVPTGRIDALEGVLTAILDESDGVPQPLVDKATALLNVAPLAGPEDPALPGAPPEPEPPADDDEPPVDDGPTDEEPAPAKGPAEKKTRTRADRRPLPTEPGKCTDCDTELDLDQTRASIIRFRIPLCRPCMANH